MSRRASSKQHPLVWVLIIFVIVGLGAVGYWLTKNQSTEPFRTLQPMDVSQYLENANSLRGNTYKIQASVQNSLAWAPTKGRLFSIEVETKSGNELLPVLIPVELNHVNVQKGQKFYFKIEIVQDGVILVREMIKV